jgi:PhoPQ-activated pathogenicity-related protein
MIVRNRLGNRILLSLCVLAAASLISSKSHADLQRYVDKPEPAFEWQVKAKIGREQTGDRIYDLQFVSQTWRGEKWRHQLQVYQPADATPGAKMFLWVTGGSASAQTIALGLELARKIKAPVAFVYHIPNQPLLEGNLREDDLIAETFVRYLKSEDDNWPLLLPMVKSVVKAMDVLQAFSKKEWSAPVDQFIVAGASKRGWTTWLTAAVDPRVGAIAPVVIDVLNMRAQMSRQIEAFGAYSARLARTAAAVFCQSPRRPPVKDC